MICCYINYSFTHNGIYHDPRACQCLHEPAPLSNALERRKFTFIVTCRVDPAYRLRRPVEPLVYSPVVSILEAEGYLCPRRFERETYSVRVTVSLDTQLWVPGPAIFSKNIWFGHGRELSSRYLSSATYLSPSVSREVFPFF